MQIEAEATHIPEYIEVSIEGLPAGTQILAGQLDLPEGSTLLVDPETLIVNVTEQQSEEALEAELEEAEAEAGIEREESDAEARGCRGRGRRGWRAPPRAATPPRSEGRLPVARREPSPGSSSGSATPGRRTPGTGTTSATSSPTSWSGRHRRAVPRPQGQPRRGGRGSARPARPARPAAGPGRAAALLHERDRRPDQGAAVLLQGAARSGSSRSTTSWTCPFDTMRLKLGGGDNGHNGLRSMRSSLGTGDFYRVRVGVGRPPGRQDPADFVLSNYSSTERKELPFQVDRAADAVESLITARPGRDPAALQQLTSSRTSRRGLSRPAPASRSRGPGPRRPAARTPRAWPGST